MCLKRPKTQDSPVGIEKWLPDAMDDTRNHAYTLELTKMHRECRIHPIPQNFKRPDVQINVKESTQMAFMHSCQRLHRVKQQIKCPPVGRSGTEEGMVVRNADKMVARLVSEGRIENGPWSMPIGLGTTTGSATPIFFFSHARKTPSTSSRVVVIKRVDLGVQFVPQLICARVRRGLRCTEVRYLCPHMLKAHIVHHEELEKPETIEDADNDSVGIQNDG